MPRVVVVGAGLAGLRAAQRIRDVGPDQDIAIVGDESHRPYNRPPLSKQVLTSRTMASDCLFEVGDDGFEWMLGNAATGLDLASRTVDLKAGSLSFDKLVIATGRRARVPHWVPRLQGVGSLRSLDDAVSLAEQARSAEHAVIIGGGFIGCEVAASLRALGVGSVSIVEPAATLMPALGDHLGRFFTDLHRANGVDVRCGTTVTGISGVHHVESVQLNDASSLLADLVLISVGSAPNTEWLTGSGLELEEGSVVCNEFGHASAHPDVVAAGDVASWFHRGVARRIRVEHWSNAVEMGRAVSDNLLASPGEKVPYAPIPTLWTDQFDVHLKVAGFLHAVDNVVPGESRGPGRRTWEGWGAGRLVAGFTVNDNRAFLDFQRRIREGEAEVVGA